MRQPVPFGKYLLLERISVGGMAEVFKAKSFGVEGFEKILAIKRILPSMAEDAEFVEMFIDEAKIAGQLSHANICQIFELGRIGDSHFIAMEFVWGRDILQIQNRFRRLKQPMPIAMACFIASKVCEGLDYAHRRKDAQGRPLGIIHRDVSPQNILISFEGEVKIIDFGIAKAVGRSSKTQAGVLKGKFGYMSPEQVRGLPIDHRSDIFAVGTILHEMLSGERLFLGDSDFATLERVRNVDVRVPSVYNSDVPPALDDLVMKALARDVEDRFAWANELQHQLQAFLTSQETAFTSKDLARFMKETFAEELAREQAMLEQYKRVGRDGKLSPPPPPPTAGAKSGRYPMPVTSPSGRFQAIAQGALGAEPGRRSPPPPTPRPVAETPPMPSGGFAEADATLIGGPSAFGGDDGTPETTEETHRERLKAQAQAWFSSSSGESELSGEHVAPVDDDEDETSGRSSPPPGLPRGNRIGPSEPTLGPAAARGGRPPPDVPAARVPTRPPSEVPPSVIFESPAEVEGMREPTADIAPPRRARSRRSGLVRDLLTGVAFFVAVVIGAFGVRSLLRKGDTKKNAPRSVLVVATTPPREGEVVASTVGPDGQKGTEVRRSRIGAANPAKLAGLEPGNYFIELTVEGASTPLTKAVELRPGEPEVLIFPLPADARAASVRFEVTPPGAVILLDGAEVVGDRSVPVTPGPHELRVSKPGYAEHRERIVVEPGDEKTHRIALKVGRGVVDIASEPGGAEIFVDGRSVGTTPFVLDDLDFGKTYKITLKLGKLSDTVAVTPKMEEPRRSLFVQLGKTVDPSAALPPDEPGKEPRPARKGVAEEGEQPSGRVGYLIANTQPWARVVIDGKDTGRSTPIPPLSKIALKEGKHIVTFVVGKGDAARNFEYEVHIKGGEDHRLIKKLGE